MIKPEDAFKNIALVVENAKLTKAEHVALDESLKLVHQKLFPDSPKSSPELVDVKNRG